MNQIRPADVLACISVVGCLVLIGIGRTDPTVPLVLVSVINFYFGRFSAKSELPRENGK